MNFLCHQNSNSRALKVLNHDGIQTLHVKYIYIYKPYVNQICSVSYIHYTNNIHNQGELVDNSGGFIYIYIYIIPI